MQCTRDWAITKQIWKNWARWKPEKSDNGADSERTLSELMFTFSHKMIPLISLIIMKIPSLKIKFKIMITNIKLLLDKTILALTLT